MKMDDGIIRLEGVSKKYIVGGSDFYALKDVNLKVGKGEMLAITGTSGSGKSTLLHIIGCLDKATSGDCLIEGRSVGGYSDSELARVRNMFFGFVLQDFALIDHRTALYNVEAPMFFNRTPAARMKKIALAAMERVGIADQSSKEIVNMSGGQKQRVAIARAIVNDPAVILADEPTGNLDEKTTNDIMDLFCSLNNEGKTILIVTHDRNVASRCKRTVSISDGMLYESRDKE